MHVIQFFSHITNVSLTLELANVFSLAIVVIIKGINILYSSRNVCISNHITFDEFYFPYISGVDFSLALDSCSSHSSNEYVYEFVSSFISPLV